MIPLELKIDVIKRSGVIGVGAGKEGIHVFVRKKKPLRDLYLADVVPRSLDGVRTRVIETGELYALGIPGLAKRWPVCPQDVNVGRYRPAPAGVSIGHKDITAGTLGYVVKQNGVKKIYSNNHVLANSNLGQKGIDEILQPGPHDGGTVENDTIAILEDFVLLKWINQFPPDIDCPVGAAFASVANRAARRRNHRTRLFVSQRPYEDGDIPGEELMNTVDGAMALPVNQDDVVQGFITLEGLVDGHLTVPELELEMPLQKQGRTSDITTGVLSTTDLTTQINYGEKYAWFHSQCAATYMMDPGDSGSLIMNREGPPWKAVGFGFAGSTAISIFNPVEFCLEAFGGFEF
jgi:hypothetical protein